MQANPRSRFLDFNLKIFGATLYKYTTRCKSAAPASPNVSKYLVHTYFKGNKFFLNSNVPAFKVKFAMDA